MLRAKPTFSWTLIEDARSYELLVYRLGLRGVAERSDFADVLGRET